MRKVHLAGLLYLTSAWALPTDPVVKAGMANFSYADKKLIVETSERAILEWGNFSIDLNESTHFNLPSQIDVVLNRVVSAIPSQILGSCTSNGQVLLINPNGILVGKDAQIDTASFIASTLDVSDSAFLAKEDLCFEGTSIKSVENLGSIKGFHGDVFLIGREVVHEGALEAVDGIAGAVAAGRILIKPQGPNRIFVRPTSEINENGFAGAFKHGGSEDALEISENPTHLLAKGTIRSSTSDGNGGEAFLLGDFIDATNLQLIVSGQTQGGNIFIGGGERGKEENLINSTHTYLDASVSIQADALENGPGGKVIVWADGHTHFLGKISARGGLVGGDGGFSEVSGKEHLDFQGRVDLSSFTGQMGTLLLDPTDILVDVAGAGVIPGPGACAICTSAFANCSTYSSNNPPTVLQDTVLQGVLQGGTNVLLDATVAGPGAGTITFNQNTNVTWTSNASLGLNAISDIHIMGIIQNGAPGAGNVILSTQGGKIYLDASANGFHQYVAVGSQDGLTEVCAPNADLILQGSAVANQTGAQLGFKATDFVLPTIYNGPIKVTCNCLSLLSGTAIFVGNGRTCAQIGHGNFDDIGAILVSPQTNPSATIDVFANGDIILDSSPNGDATRASIAVIGHGTQFAPFIAGQPPMILNGDITVTGLKTLTMRIDENPFFPFIAVLCRIGHGEGESSGQNFDPVVVNANINVNIAGDILMQGDAFFGSVINIGHFINASGQFTGDITVQTGGSLTMNGDTQGIALRRFLIGNYSEREFGINPRSFTGNIKVSACRDIILHMNDTDYFAIGHLTNTDFAFPFLEPTVIGNVEVSAGRDIIFDGAGFTAPVFNGNGCIGNNMFGAGTVTNTFVTAGRDINIIGQQSIGILAFGDVNVSAGRDINLTSLGNTVYIGTTNVNANTITRVWAGGNIVATNDPFASTIFGVAFIGRGLNFTNPIFPPFNNSLDVRAGGDIQLSTPFTIDDATVISPTSGSIFIEADSQFPLGSLWTSTGSAITAICAVTMTNPVTGGTLPIPINPNCLDCSTCASCPVCPACTPNAPCFACPYCPSCTCTTCSDPAFSFSQNALCDSCVAGGSSIMAANSPFLPIDQMGAFSVNTTSPNLTPWIPLETTSGNITIHSGPNSARAVITQDLNIGMGPNDNVFLSTTSGNIEIWGTNTGSCVRADSFLNVNIDQPIMTTGSVFISAENEIHMIAGSSITSGGNTTLIVDNQRPFRPLIGPGFFDMDSGTFITTGGLLTIYTALQNLNTINGLLNGMMFIPGTPYVCTGQEIWCSYFCDTTCSISGFPFTIAYKDCLQVVTMQAMKVVTEFLVDLHPYNEFPGWMERFWVVNHDPDPKDLIGDVAPAIFRPSEPYYIRRRHFNVINHPKTYTQLNVLFSSEPE